MKTILLDPIHTHVTYSISNSTADHVKIILINLLLFVMDGSLYTDNVFVHLTLYNM